MGIIKSIYFWLGEFYVISLLKLNQIYLAKKLAGKYHMQLAKKFLKSNKEELCKKLLDKDELKFTNYLLSINDKRSLEQFSALYDVDFELNIKLAEINNINYNLNSVQKKKRDKKIKIIFLAHHPGVWMSLKSVFETALQDKDIDAYILPNYDGRYDYYNELYPKNTIRPVQDGKYLDISSLGADYIFYIIPYQSHYPEPFQSQNLKKIAKLCWVHYGYHFACIGSAYELMNHPSFMGDLSLIFPYNQTLSRSYKSKLKIFDFEYPKINFLGFPRFELTTKKAKNISPKVISWTPRWTDPNEKTVAPSNFLILKDILIDFAKKHKNIELIIRPHGLMFDNFIKKGIMSADEVKSFKEKCENAENISLDKNEEYLPLLNKADIYVSDCTSLLPEFFVTQKPIILYDRLLDNSTWCDEINIMYNTIYRENTPEGLISRLESLLAGNDDMFETRVSAIKEFLNGDELNASEKIIQAIKDDYYNS